MNMETTMLYLYVETPLHAGVGSGLSSIDLPIQRERTTQYPMIQGSGIKGKLRATAEDVIKDETVINVLFGPPTTSGSDYAGALVIGDARILLFPVRSLNGVFAYTTSYDVLSRFKRDIERGHSAELLPWSVPEQVEEKALVTTTSQIHANNKLVLEEFSFDAQPDQQVNVIADWISKYALPDFSTDTYWSSKILSSLAILPNDDFRDFALYATEIITRIKLDRKTKTVERGALWTEEHLPSDTLLYAPIYATGARQNGKTGSKLTASQVLENAELLGSGRSTYLQLGGDETVGRGMVRSRWQSRERK